MMNPGEIIGGAAAVALFGLAAWHVARGARALRGTRLVTCPETGRPAAVDLDLRYSAVRSAFGRPHFRLKECSRWPERARCGQPCLGDLEGAPHDSLVRTILAQWYAGKQCTFCGWEFGANHWQDRERALLGSDGITREWTEIAPAKLPDALATRHPVCWNCHIVETFRRLRPDLFVERPPRAADRA